MTGIPTSWYVELRQRAVDAIDEAKLAAAREHGDGAAASSESLADAVLKAVESWKATWRPEEPICGCFVETMLRERLADGDA